MKRAIFLAVAVGLVCSLTVFAQPVPDSVWTRNHGLVVSMCEAPTGVFFIANWGRVVAMDTQGDTLWSRTFHLSIGDTIKDIAATADGGCLVSGWSITHGDPFHIDSTQPFLVRYSADGDLLWGRIYPDNAQRSSARYVLQTDDGGFLLRLGYSLAKVDADGNELWRRQERYGRLLKAADAGFLFISDSVLYKLDGTGSEVWSRSWNLSNLLIPRNDGYLVISGNDTLTIRLVDLNGDSVWTRTDVVGVEGYLYGHCTAPGGGAMLARAYWGESDQPVIHLIRIDGEGSIIWDRMYSDSTGADPYALLRTSDDSYLVGGIGFHGLWRGRGLLLRTGRDLASSTEERAIPASHEIELSASPNPFNSATVLTFALPRAMPVSIRAYDVLGRKVAVLADDLYEAGVNRVAWDCAECASGVYIVRLAGDGVNVSQRVTLVR